MTSLDSLVTTIRPVDPQLGRHVQQRLDVKTKPRGSLGRLEELACRYCMARHEPNPPMPRKAMVVMAGDHGVARGGVSAYPQEVTSQMLLNFATGGAAINVLARQANAELVVVDMGTLHAVSHARIESRRIGPGTRDFTTEPAMTVEQATHAILTGADIAHRLADEGFTLLGAGEMGIGNTTAAAALTAALLGVAPERVTGHGTGLDAAGLQRKTRAIQRALERHRPDPQRPLETLAALGGFEIAGLVGLMLAAAGRRVPVVIDGFITAAAALVAVRLAPPLRDYLLSSHRSVERGHAPALEALGPPPLLDLQLRLGEGSGAALTLPLVDAAVAIHRDMASFPEARVTDTGA